MTAIRRLILYEVGRMTIAFLSRLSRSRHVVSRYWSWGLIHGLFLIVVGILVLAPILHLTFFWEDPIDIAQVIPHSIPQLFSVSTNNLYYRPLMLVVFKLLQGHDGTFVPVGFYILNGLCRIASAIFLYLLVRFYFWNQEWSPPQTHALSPAFVSALLFLLAPVTYDATFHATSVHAWMTMIALAVLWLYIQGRQSGNKMKIAAALGLSCIALLIQESAVLLPVLLLIWEGYQGRGKSRWGYALLFFVPVTVFALIWLQIPKSYTALPLSLDLEKFLYLSQSLSFPIARLISQLGGLGLNPEAQTLVAFLLTLVLFVWAYRRTRPQLFLLLTWWGIIISLPWATLNLKYLWTASRILFFPTFAAAILWGGLWQNLASHFKHDRWRLIWLSLTFYGLLTLQNLTTLESLLQLHRSGSNLMTELVAVTDSHNEPGTRLLFINFPDRFEAQRPVYPLGFWGMVIAPVSQDLTDYIYLQRGLVLQSQSLSDFPLAAASLNNSPYHINLRGSDAHATTTLYETILWADETYWTNIRPDGSFGLQPVGDINTVGTVTEGIAQFGATARLLSADIVPEVQQIELTLYWLALATAEPHDTVFVHLVDESGTLLAQADGDSLNGLLPLSAWRNGQFVVDRRLISVPQPLPPGQYVLRVGLYNRLNGERYPAFTPENALLPDEAAILPFIVLHGDVN